MNSGAGAGSGNGGHRWGDSGHTELPYTCPSAPPLMEASVFRSLVLSHSGCLWCIGQVHGAPQAGLERWQEGSPQFRLGRACGTGP